MLLIYVCVTYLFAFIFCVIYFEYLMHIFIETFVRVVIVPWTIASTILPVLAVH